MIKVENLNLKIKDNHILSDINFEIRKGQIVGLLGHNAAGKSTLQRYIANQEVLAEGKISINGKANQWGQMNQTVLITEKDFLRKAKSVQENIEELSKFQVLDKTYIFKKLEEFDIDKSKSYGSLSKGSKQIVHILLSLSTKALVYLLDEPLSSIDIFNRKKIADLILDAQDRGATIIVTTHLINEFQMLFDRVLYLHEGKLEHDLMIEEIFEKSYENIEDFIFTEYGGLSHD
ncbi:MAG: ATP-binding cassette domain-containing protein [Lactovum sp.]